MLKRKIVPDTSRSTQKPTVYAQRSVTGGGHDIKSDPVFNVKMIERGKLKPNNYNPNHVFDPERELLIISILEDGWTQPIVAYETAKGTYEIVDGYHRWDCSSDERLMERYDGKVPVVFISADEAHRMESTVRHNRARGVHAVLKMAEIVRKLVKLGKTKEQIASDLQMEDEEVTRLLDRAGNPENFGKGFGKAWEPSADRKDSKVKKSIAREKEEYADE
jgi:ParB-like chromosome segregation protein Spo0J